MSKVDIMYELEPEFQPDEIGDRTIRMHTPYGKHVAVTDQVFDVMLSEGLIRKTSDGYVFVGRYDDLPRPKRRKKKK